MRALAFAALLTLAPFAHSVTFWNEAVNGDLSGNHLDPNDFTLADGANVLIGTTGNSDRDFFHFSLAPNQSITNVYLRAYVSDDEVSFLGLQEGSIFTEDPEAANVANLLGWTFFGTPQLGTDILPGMGTNWGSMGFTPPLHGTDYTFWLQQTGDPTAYTLEFTVVPEPSTLLVLSGLGALALRRRRKSA